mmetsp:Transcript_16449/g.24341  ORF Transcript_16449/g.24341 Transcript_16449/m.24341 type:complete len:84 (-) Transcript_16449:225-476(-)
MSKRVGSVEWNVKEGRSDEQKGTIKEISEMNASQSDTTNMAAARMFWLGKFAGHVVNCAAYPPPTFWQCVLFSPGLCTLHASI